VVHTGRPIDLGPNVAGYPAARVSHDSGFSLHWSGDSRKLYWSMGPELFTRDLTRTFTFIDRNLQQADEPETKGIPIGFTTTSVRLTASLH
jgi:hypothetical protein